MQTTRRSVLVPVLTLALVCLACATDRPAGSGPYAHVEAPTLVAADDTEDVEAIWSELSAQAADLDRLGEGAGAIPGFEPFNDPRIALSDGRFLVRGRWAADEPIAGWFQRNPDSLTDDEENPVVETLDRPVRLLVYDPDSAELLPVSPIPVLRAFSTAVSVGESSDIVLDVVVLAGEQTVAFTSGFSGAAYDIIHEVYVAPIPAP